MPPHLQRSAALYSSSACPHAHAPRGPSAGRATLSERAPPAGLRLVPPAVEHVSAASATLYAASASSNCTGPGSSARRTTTNGPTEDFTHVHGHRAHSAATHA